MRTCSLLLLFCLLSWSSIFAQTAVLKGVIFNEEAQPVPAANITAAGNGTQSDHTGFYLLEIPAGREIEITVSHIGFKKVIFKVHLNEGEITEFHPVLSTRVEQIGEIVLRSKEVINGVLYIDPETVRSLPGANAGVENLLKTLPGVNSNNELSTQYLSLIHI